jgi:hypothetical protein
LRSKAWCVGDLCMARILSVSRVPIFRVTYLELTSSAMPRTSFRIHAAAAAAAFNIDVNLGDADVGK